MGDDEGKPPNATGGLVRRLVSQTGITEAQARDLISMIGFNWSSLLREARFLAPRKK